MAKEPQQGPARLRRAAEQAPRKSGVRAAIFLLVALGAAIGTAALATRYMEARMAAARVPTAKVVIAAIDIPVATVLRPESMTVVEWPLSSRPEGAVADRKDVIGRVTTIQIAKGEAILPMKLASSGSGNGLSAILPPDMRAVAVRVDDVVGVAGFIHPGDSVDVIVTMKPESPGALTTSKIILQDIKVLAVGKELERKDKNLDKSIPATVATLMVDSEQSEMLALAASTGKLLLALRSSTDAEVVETRGMISPLLLAGAAHAAPARPEAPASAPKPSKRTRYVARRAPAAAPPPAEPKKEVVEILRGDLFEKRNFQQGERQ